MWVLEKVFEWLLAGRGKQEGKLITLVLMAAAAALLPRERREGGLL
jgi:hypothetical protein